MEELKSVTEDILPCWYELSWSPQEEKSPAIILRAHKDFIKSTKPINENAPIINFFKKDFGFEKFVGSLEGNFGFDDTLQRLPEKNGFAEFLIRIPVLEKPTGLNCPRCEGSGHEEFSHDECLMCYGSGKEFLIFRKPAYAISASLKFFFDLTESFKSEPSSNFPQLMTISVIANQEEQGGSLDGEFSLYLCRWLKSLGFYVSIPGITNAMKIAYFHMHPRLSEILAGDFCARITECGHLHLDCPSGPGGGSGLDPSHTAGYNIGKDLGYQFGSHNIDTPDQQLTRLAGLAALHDLARREIKNY